MRVLVADDQATVRSAVRRLLKEELECDVAAEAVRVEELLAKAKATQPDLVLLDWELPGLSPTFRRTALRAKHLLGALHAVDSHPKVIAMSGRPEAYQDALDAGANAFVSKGDPPERLLATLRTINNKGKEGGVPTNAADAVSPAQPKTGVSRDPALEKTEDIPDERCSGWSSGKRA